MISEINGNNFSIYTSEELTVLELIEKYGKELNACNKISKEALHFLEWLKNEGLPTETEKLINEMYENGQLESIINETIFNDLNSKIDIVKNEYIRIDDYSRLDNEIDDTGRINRAINDSVSLGFNTLHLPSKKFIVNDTIIIPRGFNLTGESMSYANEKGTILWRDEIITGRPIIQIGTGNSCPLVTIKDLTLIGSTVDVDAHGIYSSTAGLHGLVISNINFQCFGGTPIKIIAPNDTARGEFIQINKCHSGFDWGNYKGSDLPRRSTNAICTGIHLQGRIDGVNIQDSVFLGGNKTSGVGLLINDIDETLRSGDNFRVTNTSFSGNNMGIDTTGRINTIENCYLEGNNIGIVVRALNTGNTGGNNTRILNNLFSSCNNCIRIVDKSISVTRSAHLNIENNYVYTNYNSTPNGVNFIYADNNANTRAFVMNNNFITTTSGSSGVNFFSSGMTQATKNQFNGQNTIDSCYGYYNINKIRFNATDPSTVNNMMLYFDTTDKILKFRDNTGTVHSLY